MKKLDLTQIAKSLQATPQLLWLELEPLPAEILRGRPAPNEWCVNEVIGHMIEVDRHGLDQRIRTILAEDQPQLKAWPINETAAQRKDCERDTLELIDELATMRQGSANMVAALQPDQLNRSGTHPVVGALSVRDLLYEWLYHDSNHVKQILSNIQAAIWDDLGAAQQFYEIS